MATTIHEAARLGDVAEVLRILSNNPLAVNARDRHSRTPLHLAAWSGQGEVARILCDKHAEVRAGAADEMAAIHFACQKGHMQVIRLLLAAGASVNDRTRKGLTPLHFAVQGKHAEVIKLLLRKGASTEVPNKAGKTAFDLATDEDIRSIMLAFETEKTSRAGNVEHHEKHGKNTGTAETNESLQTQNTHQDITYSELDKGDTKHQLNADDSPPPTKKVKIQLSHLAADQGIEDAENG